MTDEAPLAAKEMIALLDEALSGVPDDEHPERLAWTLWGIGPWSSMSDTIRHLYGVMRERHAEAVDAHAPTAALAQLTLARTFMAERAYRFAKDILDGSRAVTSRSGLGTLSRLNDALSVRVALQTGHLSDAFERVGSLEPEAISEDPVEFQVESRLARGLVFIIQGRLQEAGEELVIAGRQSSEHKRPDLGRWQASRALAAQSHVMFRANLPERAAALLNEALQLAATEDALHEGAEWTLAHAAYGLCTGVSPNQERVRVALSILGMTASSGRALDVLTGLPVDLAGQADAGAMVGACLLAAEERRRAFDPAGRLLATLMGALIQSALGDAPAGRASLQSLAQDASHEGVGALAIRAGDAL
jgi:hypothetical protein